MPRDANRVAETATTTGTGTITLGGAVAGHQAFGAAFGTGGNTDTSYGIVMDSGQWEVGLGTYLGGTNQLQRDTVLASSTGSSKVNFPAGSKTVYVARPAEGPVVARARRETDVPVEIRAIAGQSGDLMQAYNAVGNKVASVDSTGVLDLVKGGLFAENIRVGIDGTNVMGSLGGGMFIYASGGGNVGFKVNGPTGGNVAAIYPSGTSAGQANVIMTREKGDARYASISSLRYKDEVEAAGRIPDFLAIGPCTWIWGGSLAEDDFRRGGSGYGLVAEHLHAVSPQFVTLNDEGLPDALNVGALIGALHAEIKHLSAITDELQATVAAQAARLDAIEQMDP